jgi:hypothetical protein
VPLQSGNGLDPLDLRPSTLERASRKSYERSVSRTESTGLVNPTRLVFRGFGQGEFALVNSPG